MEKEIIIIIWGALICSQIWISRFSRNEILSIIYAMFWLILSVMVLVTSLI